MKRKVGVFAIVMAGMLSTPAIAGFGGSHAPVTQLEEGVSVTKILGGSPVKYELNVDREITLRVSSESFPGVSSSGNWIRAQLVDETGMVVSEAADPNGHFLMEQSLSPGKYKLVVSGNTMGGNGQTDRSRYNLHVKFE